MNEPLHNSDEILLDRLVDGELSADERRDLLASLDDRSGGWRQCALAFLEAQAFNRQLRQLTRESQATVERPRADGRRQCTRGRSVSWYVLAASVFVAFTLGLALRHDAFPLRGIATPSPFDQVATTEPQEHGARPEVGPNNALTLWVRDASGRPQPLHVPLVDARAMDPQLGLQFRSAIPASMRDRLEQRGYQVESKQRYAPLWLENGRPMVVPVEDTRIVPVSQTVY